ncbi:MAG: hypothetical protein QGG40_22240, partial [Myxococcota bacterium]|nr:hypothetical protein [Myxococcota bacterium]
GEPLLVRGKLEKSPDGCKVLAESAELLSDMRIRRTSRIRLQLDRSELDHDRATKLVRLLHDSPGSCPVEVLVRVPGRGRLLLSLDEARVSPSEELLQGIEEVFRRPDTVCLL